jgi:fatty-acyl-CoA synthase
MLLVHEVLAAAASAAPHRVALTLDDQVMTFAEMQSRANRTAHALFGWGVRRGDRVAYWADMAIGASPLQFALGRLGAAFVPFNPDYADDEARAALAYLGPRLLLTDAAHAEQGEALAGDLGIPHLGVAGRRGLDELADASSPDAPRVALPSEDDVFTIFLTSGSTGTPKGAMISQRATWLRAYAGATGNITTGGAGQLVMFPLFHMAGWTFAYYAWSAHQPAHLVRRAEGEVLLGALERHRPASLYCIPAIWRRVLDDKGDYDTSSLEWALIGTSRVEPELLAEIKERFPGSRTTVNYGSTEAGRAISLGDSDLFAKPYSVGLPVPGFQARQGADGELLLRTDTMMSGYYALEKETARALEHGWYHTGDLVEFDDEGYCYVVGRTKEMIRSGGEWVAPVEIEAALRDHPGIADVAVFGAADASWGEVVCAAVVVADGADPPSVEEVRRFLRGRLAPFKHPRRVVVLDELPRTSATGQIQRSLLARGVS